MTERTAAGQAVLSHFLRLDIKDLILYYSNLLLKYPHSPLLNKTCQNSKNYCDAKRKIYI
jgi:hypothetical protein